MGSRVLIIEDHPLVAKGVVELFTTQQDLSEVFVENSLELGLAKLNEYAANQPIDLVLLDLGLPGHSGLSAFWSFREQSPAVPVAVFSAEDNPQTMRLLLKGGARGFIPKTMDPDQMLGALRLMLGGGIFVPMESLGDDPLQNGTTDMQAPSPLTNLTHADALLRDVAGKSLDPLLATILAMPPRRRDVLRLMAGGYSNKEICRAHGVSMNTVKTHVTLIFSTFNLKSRQELMMLLMTHNLLPKLREQSGSDGHPNSESPTKGTPSAPRHSAWPLQ